MPEEAGVYVTYNNDPGTYIRAHQICEIDSIKLVEMQYLPADDPLNLIIEVEIGIKNSQ